MQERAPALLRNNTGELRLSWILTINHAHNLRRLGMTRGEFNSFVKQWPRSEQGRRLLEGLRWGWWGCLMAAAWCLVGDGFRCMPPAFVRAVKRALLVFTPCQA